MDFLHSGAELSDDLAHRWLLWRELDLPIPVSTVMFIGVNPSTASATINDQTVLKIAGFTMKLGFKRFVLGNKFAYRAKDVNELKWAQHPIGDKNDFWLFNAMSTARMVVAAWGPLAKLPPQLRTRWRDIAKLAAAAEKPLHCLGVAKDGHPRHPLMLSYETKCELWRAPD